MDVLLTIDWKAVFVPQHSLLELMLRGSLMYLAIFVLLRIMLRRQAGGIGTSDVLVIMLIAEVAGNGIAPNDESVVEACCWQHQHHQEVMAGRACFADFLILGQALTRWSVPDAELPAAALHFERGCADNLDASLPAQPGLVGVLRDVVGAAKEHLHGRRDR